MKKSLIRKIIILLSEAAREVVPEFEGKVEITTATQERFGNYQCNSAMRLASLTQKNTRDIAQEIVSHIKDDGKIFSKVEVAGPGFINITVDKDYISERLNEILASDRLDIPLPERKERVIVEFSSPNIAKEMHVGHLRSTIIGECLARLFTFLGHDILRLNHLGDWGTQFGMLITYIQEVVPDRLEEATLADLMQWYKASKVRFDEDPAFKKRAQAAVVALQRGEKKSRGAWEKICAISRAAYAEVYTLLDVTLKERGESFYNPVLPEIVQDLEQKGLINSSEGAKCLFIEGINLPLMVVKSDGGFGYDITDIAAMRQRVQEERADRIIVVTDAGQSLHFELVYKACVKAGYLDPKRVRFDHVPFGLVLGADGKKFRTRSGETERLVDLLSAAVKEAERILEQREHDMSRGEVSKLAKILGIDAVKYADLACNRISDYVFSYERMLRFEGNTATFILYSYVRIAGIKRKIQNVDIEQLKKRASIKLQHPSEVSLGLHLLRFQETLEACAEELYPHFLTEYLYNLAQKFNGFFRDCRVEGSLEQDSRLLLCETTAKTMERGLNLLGLQIVERM